MRKRPGKGKGTGKGYMFDANKLTKYPTQPGVYLMKGKQGAVLYVGKAKNLRQRIKQYFVEGRDGRTMVPFLISKIEDVETIVVTSEKEALLLENNLIKQHKPRYNALLKDDKSYVALKINHKHKWPMVTLVRYRGKPKDDALYFGPYSSAQAARKTLDFLNKIFPLRQCSDAELARRPRPCILYEMGRCVGPCARKCTEEDYAKHLERTIKFLRGQDKDLLQELYTAMERASDALEFELAAHIQDTIKQIEKTVEAQRVDKPLGSDTDVIGLFRQGGDVILSEMIFRGGRLLGSKSYNFTNIIQEDPELLHSFLLQHYENKPEIPHEILLPVALGSETESLEEILSTNQKRKVHILSPQKGEKKELVNMACINAKAFFEKEKDDKTISEKTLLEMQEKLSLTRYPKRIECFDNSHIQGSEPVASMVAFTDGHKDSNRYRKYKIRTTNKPDDYQSMYEVLYRRYKRAKEESDLPDLVIVDGGKGQLNIALKVMAELDISTVDVIGLAKEEGRHDKGVSQEQIFLPQAKDPILLRSTSLVLFLLQKIRDEAHRVALTFHQKRRTTMVGSAIDHIPGIGPARRKKLLQHFGSVKKLKEASLEELRQIKGLSESTIQALWTFISK